MRLIFQNLLFEQVESIRDLSLSVWTDLIASIPASELRTMYEGSLLQTASLLFTPIGTSRNNIAMDSSLVMRPSGQTLSPAFAKPEATAGKKNKKREVDDWGATQGKPHNLDGPMIRGDVDLVGEGVMIRTRVTASIAFGRLMAIWPEDVQFLQRPS
jgi:hypothetical protein